MKIYKPVAAIAVLILAAFLTGCAGNDEALFGVWRWGANGSYYYVFNEDGTGERGFPEERRTFTWTTNGERLNINLDRSRRGEIRNESWNFEIADGVLSIDNRRVDNRRYRYVFDDREQNDTLIGAWAWDEVAAFVYTLNEDGTGTRGFPGEIQEFTWSATGTHLHISRPHAPVADIRGEIWAFSIDEDALTITSFHDEEFSMNLSRME